MQTSFNAKDIKQDMVDFFIENKDEMFDITFEDGTRQVKGIWMTFNAILWKTLNTRNIPIRQDRHLFIDELYTKTNHSKYTTRIFEDTIRYKVTDLLAVKQELLDTNSIVYNMIFLKFNKYHRTVDIFMIAETMLIPEFAEVANTDMTPYKAHGIRGVEAGYKKLYDKIYDLVQDPKFKDKNALYPFAKTGIFSKSQLPQALIACGVRTDIDERTMPYAIEHSYLTGFHDAYELALDSLSAKKSLRYNQWGMKKSQYTNRSQQILAASIEKIYPGDCGTNLTTDIVLKDHFKNDVVGKNIVVNGQLVTLTSENVSEYVGTTIHMRSPLVCRHPDGVCQCCGGKLTDYIGVGSDTIIGVLAAMELMGPVAQLVLSNKHFSITNTAMFVLAAILEDYLSVDNNQIYIKPNYQKPFTKQYIIGLIPSDVSRLNDLLCVTEKERKGSYFTKLTTLSLKDVDTGELIVDNIPLEFMDNSFLHLSDDVLKYIVTYGDSVLTSDKDMVWLNLCKFNPVKPIITCPSVNESTIEFSKRVKMLFASKVIRSHRSVHTALQSCVDTIYEKSHPNIMHIEILLKACMITSGSDYSVPVVTDPNNVSFAELSSIISERSIGGQLAFEQWMRYKTNPRTYLFPKGKTFYDNYLIWDNNEKVCVT